MTLVNYLPGTGTRGHTCWGALQHTPPTRTVPNTTLFKLFEGISPGGLCSLYPLRHRHTSEETPFLGSQTMEFFLASHHVGMWFDVTKVTSWYFSCIFRL